MSKIALVTDSTAYIPIELRQKYDIKVAAQMVIWGEETLRDELDITPNEFYERLKTADVMPTTSQATIGAFKEIFEPLVAENRPILAQLISDELSGTIQSAIQAKAMFPEAVIEIVDSRSTAMGLGYQVLALARAAEAGKSFDEVVAMAREIQANTGVLVVVDTLEFLHRGGRIGGAARLLGTALNLKPILELQDGRLEPLERVRTKKKAEARVLDLLAEKTAGKSPLRLAVMHAAAETEARSLLERARERFELEEEMISDVTPAVGAHVGPGTLAICYCVGV